MMRKKTNYTQVTPIPSYIPRQLAIDILHSHGEIITINPLVTGYQPVKAPRDASADEFYSTWYEIDERVQFVPGAGKMGSGKIKFKGCFHDMDWGLQTHIYAPMNVDLRNKWRIAGNQPGEPRENPELGIGAPAEGLYLREDVEIKCNFTMVSFVKKEMKAASKVLVDRLIKKAELLDAGVLHAMMENGRLKTVNPADRSYTVATSSSAHGPQSPYLSSPKMQHPGPASPTFPGGPPGQQSAYALQPQYAQNSCGNDTKVSQSIPMELPGDYSFAPPKPSHLQPPSNRFSVMSELSGDSPEPNDGRWSGTVSEYQPSASSRPTSYATDTSVMRSPRPENTSFGSDLKPTPETREEHAGSDAAMKRLDGGHHDPWPRYNPQDYAQKF